MTDTKNTRFNIEDTHENLSANLELIHEEADKLEQCLIAVATFVRYGVDVNKFETMLDEILDIAGNIDSWTDHASMQYNRLNEKVTM